jgi:hypothetical protein
MVRPTASLVVGLPLLAALLLACSSAVSGAGVIFIDYTDGVEAVLQPGLNNPAVFDKVYPTGGGPGSISFGLLWHGDPSDQFSFSTPQQLSIAALNNLTVCSYSPGDSVTLTASTPVCNYSASWSQPISGVLSITYNNAGAQPVSAQQISIAFSTAAPAVSSSSSSAAAGLTSSTFHTSSSRRKARHSSSSSSSAPPSHISSSSSVKKKKKSEFITSSSSAAAFTTSSSSK